MKLPSIYPSVQINKDQKYVHVFTISFKCFVGVILYGKVNGENKNVIHFTSTGDKKCNLWKIVVACSFQMFSFDR